MKNLIDDEFKSRLENVLDVTREIEEMKAKSKLNYIECVVEVCNRHDLDIETISQHLSQNIKEKIEADALELNLLKYTLNTLI